MNAKLISTGKEPLQSIQKGGNIYSHFQNIISAEIKLFSDHNIIKSRAILPVLLGEIKLKFVTEAIKSFSADVAIIFGSSWIKDPLFSFLPKLKYNLHMGISPRYRGHSTNFWAFYNQEPEYVGATILELSKKLDQGNIVCHVNPKMIKYSNYYDFSMSTVIDATQNIITILDFLYQGKKIITSKCSHNQTAKYYKSGDLSDSILNDFLDKHRIWYRNFLLDTSNRQNYNIKKLEYELQ